MNLWAVVTSIVVVIAFAAVAKRLLGAYNTSPARTLAAAIIGLALGWSIALFMTRVEDVEPVYAEVTGWVMALVFTMVALVTFEVLSDQRLRRRRSAPIRPLSPLSSLRRRWANTRRTAEITGIAARHGLGRAPAASEGGSVVGRRLAGALDEAGGIYVKLGQILSTRPDLLGHDITSELAGLQQDAAPVPRDDVEAVIRSELGMPVDEAFASFDWTPLGSASLAQVHRATMFSGDEVVVKVQRPGIDEAVERDLAIITDISRYVEVRTEWGELLSLSDLTDEFADTMRKELDYGREARNTEDVAAAFAGQPLLVIPRIHPQLSTDRVLVQEYIDGPTLGRTGIVGGERGRRLADQLFEAQVTAMLAGERFHADPHPGNLILIGDDELGLIDFGLATRLDAFERAALNDVLSAIAINDPAILTQAAFTIGEPRREVDPSQLERALARIMNEHLGPHGQPGAEMLEAFLDVVYEYGLSMSANITALFRALATLQGSLEQLSPGFPLIDRARDLAQEQMWTAVTPESLVDEAKHELIRFAPILRRAPLHLDRIADQLAKGRLGVRVSLLSNDEDVRVLSGLINRLVLAFIAVGLGIVSVMLFNVESEITLVRQVTLFDILGFIGLFTGATLLMRVTLEVLRDRV